MVGQIATDGDGAGPNSAGFEAKLPANWNGKFVASGPGGLAGRLASTISATDARESLQQGYAFVTTDTGHAASDASWMLLETGKPNTAKVADYYYRASHQVTVAAKDLVLHYYKAERIKRAYFDGCSNGGRMGLMDAIRYPDDYDGIIAGSPYMDIRTQLWGYKNTQAFLKPDTKGYIPASKFPAIDAAVLAQCDIADGTRDGLIQNPARCAFDPASLVPDTLTPEQANALKLVLQSVTDSDGKLAYPGSPVGDLGSNLITSEGAAPAADAASTTPWSAGAPMLWGIADSVVRNFVEKDPGFNANTKWPESNGVVTTEALKAFDAATAAGDTDQPQQLRAFLAQGKKLILYHGYSDPLISPYRTVLFYTDLASLLGGYEQTQKQVRLFMVPGMGHCSGGKGPNSFDTLDALDNWVEKGSAPNALIASHSPAAGTPADRTMPLCMFPGQAKYKGNGDLNDAANWSCPASSELLAIGANGAAAGLVPAAAR